MMPTFAARFVSGALTLTWLLSIGCGPSEQATQAVGTFTLLTYNGKSLPFDQGPLPVRCGPVPTNPPMNPPCDPRRPQPCHHLLTEGTLTLDRVRGRYDIFYLTRNSCGASILSLSDQTGDFQPAGGAVIFRVSGNHESPEFERFSGIVKGDLAVVDWYSGTHLQLRRAGAAAASVLSGQFALVERRARNINVASTVPPPAVCQYTIKEGSLTLVPTPGLEPSTGRFRVFHDSVDSCQPNLPVRFEELGTYEQVVDTLVFEADVGIGVHRYRGRIGAGEIALHIGGESDLIFRR